jgi:putative endonuclease
VVSGKRTYWVYIMTNRSESLYMGVTNNLARRVYEHRQHLNPGFTTKYRIDRLIHAEPFGEFLDAIAREKQLKGWTRARKLELVAETNPELRDLGEEWFGPAGDR